MPLTQPSHVAPARLKERVARRMGRAVPTWVSMLAAKSLRETTALWRAAEATPLEVKASEALLNLVDESSIFGFDIKDMGDHFRVSILARHASHVEGRVVARGIHRATGKMAWVTIFHAPTGRKGEPVEGPPAH